MHNPQALIDQVRQRGCRVTRQRAAVLQALCELDGHASAERVYKQITRDQVHVDLSTVYRTLERLRDLRILSQTDLGRGSAEYEIVTDQPHHHLVCLGCRRVANLDHKYVALLADSVRRDLGFAAVLDHFAVYGLCQECQDKRQDPSEEQPGESVTH